ncbi:MAG: hypothetical protein R2810_01585 [Flavobacteriales bacterium]
MCSAAEPDEACHNLRLLEPETAAEAILELDEDVRENCSKASTSGHRRKAIENESTTPPWYVRNCPRTRPKPGLEDAEQADDIEELLGYEDGTAASHHGQGAVKAFRLTVACAILEMRRQAEEVDQVYTASVVDKDGACWASCRPSSCRSPQSTRTLIKHLRRDR